MSESILNARRRMPSGKGGARQLRLSGSIPGVYYGHREQNIHFAVSSTDLIKLLRSRHRIINFQIEGEEVRACLIRELQRDPVDDRPYHIDLLAIHRDEKLTTSAPIRLIGTPTGVKTGSGVLEHGIVEVSLECLPSDIPEFVEVDVSSLSVGQSIHVKDLVIPNVRVLDDPGVMVAHISAPTVHKEETPVPEAGEAPAEPVEPPKE